MSSVRFSIEAGHIMEINGIGHIFVTAGDFERSRAFYARLLPQLGLKPVRDDDERFYCVGGRTGFGIRRPLPEHAGARFVQGTVGLHHICFRARSRNDVDVAYQILLDLGATILRVPQEGEWAPGYYSLLFEDPDGIRLEINHLP